MSQHLQYRGYDGSVLYSAEDKLLHGRLMGIRDFVTYEGASVRELEKNFRAAVDEYISDCERDGKQPNVPYKGSFNVRVTIDLHQRAAKFAQEHDLALNAVVQNALSSYLDQAENPSWQEPSSAPSAKSPSNRQAKTSRSARNAAA